jgi:hypothetical protein
MIAHTIRFRAACCFALLTLLIPALRAESPSERLTSRQRAPAPKVESVAVGDEVHTEAGQRRRVVLPDGSVLYVNQKTTIKVDAPRRLTLTGGEVFTRTTPLTQFPFSSISASRSESGSSTNPIAHSCCFTHGATSPRFAGIGSGSCANSPVGSHANWIVSHPKSESSRDDC